MDRYQEHRPDLDPHGVLAQVWVRTTGAGPRVARVVPDGCIDLIWHRESGALFVAGPDTVPHVTPIGPGTLVGLRFSPGAAPALLRVSAAELRDGRVPLDALWPHAEVRRLGAVLHGTGTATSARRVLQEAVAGGAAPRDRVAGAVLELARSGARVGSIADATGLSERQLHRRCLVAFGYGPKVLHRILRFDRARRLARSGVDFADIAYRTGYADQAHLAREVKALGGLPLGQFT